VDSEIKKHEATTCAECGAEVPAGGRCRENFHQLLLLEGEVPGAAGSVTHFFAVASYNLQHPESVGLTAEAAIGLLDAFEDILDDRLTLEQLRTQVRRAASSAGRVTRRVGEPAPTWFRGPWPLTCCDVIAAGAGAYRERVREWAESIRETLSDWMPTRGETGHVRRKA
jgi:hypothetical protein